MKPNLLQNMSKEDRRDFYIAIPIILAALFFILYYSFPAKEEATAQKSYTILFENTMQINSVELSGDTYKPLSIADGQQTVKHPEKIATIIPASVQTRTASSQESTVADSPTIDSIGKSPVAIDSLNIQSTPAIANEDTLSTLKSALPIDTTAKIKGLSSDSPKANLSSETDCIIIVGAFGKVSNVTRVMSKLVDEGYDAFTIPHKGLTRVGIYHSCKEQRLLEALNKIRADYAKDAMVLKKK